MATLCTKCGQKHSYPEDEEALRHWTQKALILMATSELERRRENGESYSNFDIWLLFDKWGVWEYSKKKEKESERWD